MSHLQVAGSFLAGKIVGWIGFACPRYEWEINALHIAHVVSSSTASFGTTYIYFSDMSFRNLCGQFIGSNMTLLWGKHQVRPLGNLT